MSRRADGLVRVYGSPGTLYARCGGVFGVSAFADRCMDKWMADAVLNANQAVATWHVRAQRCGFKFLVVQIVSHLTGGPQQYTGRPLDTAHKHLNISEDEWNVFMEIFNDVCNEFGLPPGDIDDLNALMISMEEDCVTFPGDRVPANPGPARPSGSSLYARLGGVYPIALFADRLVDALLQDPRVHIPTDVQKRNEAALKYLMTEVVCSVAGGPEVITARDADETKLLIPKCEWRIMMATVETAADHIPAAVRSGLVQVLERSKELIVDPTSEDVAPGHTGAVVASVVKDLSAAAAGQMLSKEAIAARHANPSAFVAARKRVFGDPRTLYGRGGGVFGLAKFADKLMDTWMANPALNANHMVARWHESHQKCGFKFLVTQILGYLTGGPQRYTGRPMDEAHKHLSISDDQWSSFMADANRVFQDFQLDSGTSADFRGILESYKTQCVLGRGEVAAPDPGKPKPNPSATGTLYYRLGGVYPIAEFVDRLVDLVLSGKINLQSGPVAAPDSTRHPSGLKYVLTELICNCTGGPEVVTSKGFDEAKLGVQREDWADFLALAQGAASMWPNQHLRTSLLAAITTVRHEICVGVLDAGASLDDKLQLAMQKLSEAGFDNFHSTAAMDETQGDVDKALELLAAGWQPDGTSIGSMASMLAPRSGGCPFGGSAAEAGSCPFTGATPSAAKKHRGIVEAPQAIDDRLLDAVRTLAERGVPAGDIAKLLGIDESAVTVSLGSGAMGGRVLGNKLQDQLDLLTQEEPDLCCPVSLMLFVDPVIASDGFMYERDSVSQLVRSNMASPMTREPLTKQFIPSKDRKSQAFEFRQKRCEELLAFAESAFAEEPLMAITSLQRVSEYVQVLKPASCPGLVQKAGGMWRKMGKSPPVELGGA